MLTEYVIPGDKIELTEVRSEESDKNGNIERRSTGRGYMTLSPKMR